MNPEGSELLPERSSLLKEVLEYVLCTVSREDLLVLLTDPQAWATFVAKADFSRTFYGLVITLSSQAHQAALWEEAVALREELSQLSDEDMRQKEQEGREKLLQVFPHMKVKLEEHIAQLLQLADKAGKIHRDCTISNVVSNSTGIVSGILTILGLSLTPVTAGASLVLCATGMGLGIATTLTKVSTSIVEQWRMLSLKSKAQPMASDQKNKGELPEQIANKDIPKIFSLVENIINGLEDIEKCKNLNNFTKIKQAVAGLLSSKRMSAQGSRPLNIILEATPQALGKAARVMGIFSTVFFLGVDVFFLVKDSKHLHEGAKLESAETLRQQARDLERMLEMLGQIHRSLRQDPAP
ncbi:apolipoprotein L2-like [Talpa occidentalis]|uniref:apolipoprotein L2-like n=1 Tax=Talpa occidentalis TaxID=50954 RepID=UPI0018904289|nr:apolipoprotein L2-like [Talpa occidentalis]